MSELPTRFSTNLGPMGLDGLRAWIGEVERKLGIRTNVMLVLAVIAIAIAGAGIYLAIDTRESSVSESDVQTLQQELEARIDSASGGGSRSRDARKPKSKRCGPRSRNSNPPKSQGKGESGGSSGEKEKAPESAKP